MLRLQTHKTKWNHRPNHWWWRQPCCWWLSGIFLWRSYHFLWSLGETLFARKLSLGFIDRYFTFHLYTNIYSLIERHRCVSLREKNECRCSSFSLLRLQNRGRKHSLCSAAEWWKPWFWVQANHLKLVRCKCAHSWGHNKWLDGLNKPNSQLSHYGFCIYWSSQPLSGCLQLLVHNWNLIQYK